MVKKLTSLADLAPLAEEMQLAVTQYGTAESHRHGEYIQETTQDGSRARNTTADVLGYYRRKGVLSSRQEEAGHLWYRDWYSSGLRSSSASALGSERVDGANRENLSSHQAECYMAYRSGEDAIRTPRHCRVAYAICIIGNTLPDIIAQHQPYYARTEHLSPILKEAMDDLADFYDLHGVSPDGHRDSEFKNVLTKHTKPDIKMTRRQVREMCREDL